MQKKKKAIKKKKTYVYFHLRKNFSLFKTQQAAQLQQVTATSGNITYTNLIVSL